MGIKYMSIEAEGLTNHINRYFMQRNLPYRYGDVIRLKEMRVGGRPLSIQRQVDELGMNSRNTLYAWHRYIDQQKI